MHKNARLISYICTLYSEILAAININQHSLLALNFGSLKTRLTKRSTIPNQYPHREMENNCCTLTTRVKKTRKENRLEKVPVIIR